MQSSAKRGPLSPRVRHGPFRRDLEGLIQAYNRDLYDQAGEKRETTVGLPAEYAVYARCSKIETSNCARGHVIFATRILVQEPVLSIF